VVARSYFNSGTVLQKTYVISTGSIGGNYYRAGTNLAKILTDDNADISVVAIPSDGSKENIKNLESRFADFGIVQRNILLQNLHKNDGGIKNIEVLLPLFQEKLIIYTSEKESLPFNLFKERVAKEKISVGVTSEIGYSYQIFDTVTTLLAANKQNFNFVIADYTTLVEKIKSGELDFLVTFSLPLQELKSQPVVYFSPQQVSFLRSRIKQLSVANFDDATQQTLGSWSFLVGLNNSIQSYGAEKLIKNLVTGLSHSDKFIMRKIRDSVALFQKNPQWNDLYFATIPVNQYLLQELHYRARYNWGRTVIIAVGVLFASIFLYVWYGYVQQKRGLAYVWSRYRRIIMIITTIILLYILSVELLLLGERQFFAEVGSKSALLDLTRYDLHFWILIRNLSGNDGGMFPLSSLGKLMVSFSAYVIYVGTIFLALSELIEYYLRSKKQKGLMNVNFKNHTIIAGWNDGVPDLIKEILYVKENFTKEHVDIVCIIPNPEEAIDNNEYFAELVHRDIVRVVKGYIKDEYVLKQCRAHLAKTIVLLAEDRTRIADERTLLRALALTKYCKEQQHTVRRDTQRNNNDADTVIVNSPVTTAYIIAQVNSKEFEEDLRRIGVNAVVNTVSMGNGILIQTLFNRGVTKLLNEVLEYNDANEFYIVDLKQKQNAHLRHKTFDELLMPLRRAGVLLVAIRVTYYDQFGNDIVDENELRQLLKKEGLTRQVIVNPITETETRRKADADDQLIVFASTKAALDEAIRKVRF